MVARHRFPRSILLTMFLLSFSCLVATTSFRFGLFAAAKERSSRNNMNGIADHSSSEDDRLLSREEEEEVKQQQQQQQRSLPEEGGDDNLFNATKASSTSWLDGLEMEEYPTGKHNDDESSLHSQQQQLHIHQDDLPDHMLQNPLLQVPCGLQVEEGADASSSSSSSSYSTSTMTIHPVSTFVDTGAQVTILSWRAAQRARVLQLIDRRYAGHAIGVGQCRVLGRIPAGALRLHLQGHCIPSPAITVLDDNDANGNNNNNHEGNRGVELLLGLDFLRDYQAILNIRDGEMRLVVKHQKEEAVIPFIIPRSRAQSNHLNQNTPMLQQCKSWILPLGASTDDEEDGYSDVEHGDSMEPIDMSGV